MDGIHEWGLELIRALQAAHSPALIEIMRGFTLLGDEEFLLVLIPLLIWCFDFALGARVGILYLLGSYVNGGLKGLFGLPRPYDLDPVVQLKETDYTGADAFGLPSGHAMSAVVISGLLAAALRKTWVWVGAVLLMILVGFSRVYLGLHFPTDVLGGWLVGGLLLAGWLFLVPGIEAALRRAGLGTQLALGSGVPLVLAALNPGVGAGSAAGVLIGVGVGLPLALRFAPMSAAGLWWKRILRFVVGAVPLIGLYLGLKLVFPKEGEELYELLRVVRYSLMGLWASLGAPWLFLKLRLAERLAAGSS
jgi:membrane-associated phospholipid phosphatase